MTDGYEGPERRQDYEVAEEAATRAVSKTFLQFDVDLKNPESVKSFRADLDHAHDSRIVKEQVGLTIRRTLIVAGITSALGLLVLGFKSEVSALIQHMQNK
jgi:hypothetical protein